MSEEKETINATDLWLALTMLPRPHRVVPFPRNLPTGQPVGEIAIWPLTQEEQMAANAEADRFTKKLLKDPQLKDQVNLGYSHTYANEVAIQVLFRACRDPLEPTKRAAFPSPAQMRERLTTDEVGVLFNQYCTVASEVGPIVAYMSKDEREALIMRLAEGGSAFPFDSLSSEEQKTLVLTMASQLVSCWTAMCSLGSPPDVHAHLLEKIQAKAEESKTEADDDDGEVVDD